MGNNELYQSEDDCRTEEAREKKWKRYSDKTLSLNTEMYFETSRKIGEA